MKIRLITTIIAVLAGAAFLIWWLSPEQVIKRQITGLIDNANVSSTMGNLGRANRGESIAEYLAPTISVNAPATMVDEIDDQYDRERVSRNYSALASYCKQISSTDLVIENIEVDGDKARADFRMDLIVEISSRRPFDGIFVAQTEWVKTDEGWLLKSIAWEEEPRR